MHSTNKAVKVCMIRTTSIPEKRRREQTDTNIYLYTMRFMEDMNSFVVD